MTEQHKRILLALGLSKELSEAETLTDDQIAQAVTAVRSNFQTQFLNDDSFLEAIPEEKTSKTVKKNIESAQYARFMNEGKDVAREFGIDTSDLSPDEQKSLKAWQRAVITKARSTGATPETIRELQDKLSQALGEKAAIETSVEKKLQDAETNAAKKYGAKLERAAAISELTGIKGITAKPDYIVDRLLTKVKDRFTPVFNPETMNFEIKQKSNPQLDALKSDGKHYTFSEIAIDVLKEDELYKDPVQQQTTQQTTTVQVNGDSAKPVIPEYILKTMNKGLAEEAVK